MLVAVCTRERECARLPYVELRAWTLRLVADPRWEGPWPVIAEGTPPGIDGTCVGRYIRYASTAPICVVPHELAHMRSGEVAHGPRWEAWFLRLVGWLSEC